MKTTEFSSSSSPSDRRVGALLRHLTAGTDSPSTDRLSSVIASPTSEVSSGSVFAHLVQAPEDPILGVHSSSSSSMYPCDPSPIKLNLGIGAYGTEEGKPLVLNVVRKAEQQLINDSSRVKEYLPIVGLVEFNKLSAKLKLGADSPAIRENRVTTVECLSGTGSLRVGGEFLAKHYHQRTIYITQPTWANHPKISTLEQAGLSVKTYHYYDPSTRGLNFQGLLEDIGDAPPGFIVLLHACAHNPTGVDPTLEQWEQNQKVDAFKRIDAIL
uniref:Aminotransferase class I/classII large domain-containing protein n=1 Tax=Brassica oleracea TaxID=3712 RepID=A0A3P6DIJ8_BRAOL|nr:unnamed protein product [Brassica oleracea]